MTVNRRRFLAAGATSLGRLARAHSAARPDILLCIADDWAWPHASAYGDGVVRTAAFDRVARQGVLFTNAFCAAPSCTPSRAAI
ncbi:MAG: sulfatase-like hydrolase/transferase, partial [Bryobacteraceae bacterium]